MGDATAGVRSQASPIARSGRTAPPGVPVAGRTIFYPMVTLRRLALNGAETNGDGFTPRSGTRVWVDRSLLFSLVGVRLYSVASGPLFLCAVVGRRPVESRNVTSVVLVAYAGTRGVRAGRARVTTPSHTNFLRFPWSGYQPKKS